MKKHNQMKRTYISPAARVVAFESEGLMATSGPQVSETETMNGSEEYLSRRKRSGWNSTLWGREDEEK